MKAKELRKFSKKELENLLIEKRKKLQDLNFQLVSGKVKNVKEAKELKKDIARILTIIKDIKE